MEPLDNRSEKEPDGRETEWIERACPICKKKFRLEKTKIHDRGQSYYPFCSQRCRLVDLGRWMNADYRFTAPSRVETEELEVDEEE